MLLRYTVTLHNTHVTIITYATPGSVWLPCTQVRTIAINLFYTELSSKHITYSYILHTFVFLISSLHVYVQLTHDIGKLHVEVGNVPITIIWRFSICDSIGNLSIIDVVVGTQL